MLAGLLALPEVRDARMRLTCAIPFELEPQRRRFPQIEWFAYTAEQRDELVRACDAWVGLGGAPFQTDSGEWFLAHLAEEVERCRRWGKLMYLLGVGVNNRAALDDVRARAVVAAAERIWVRDRAAGEMLRGAGLGKRVVASADLAHAFLSEQQAVEVEAGTVGFVLCSEDATLIDVRALATYFRRAAAKGLGLRWLGQELRDFVGTERALLRDVPADVRPALDVRWSDYARGTCEELFAGWGAPEVLVSCRYHAAIVGAWRGARVVIVERNDKLRAIASELDLPTIRSLTDADEVAAAVASARPVARSVLGGCAERARAACRELLASIQGRTRAPGVAGR